MIGPQVFALALPLLAAGHRTDVAAAAITEVSGGVRPIEFGESSVPVFNSTLSLPIGMRILSRRSAFQLSYAPRLQLQIPNAADTYRPLLMHTLAGDYGRRLTRRTSLRANLSGAAGETSYNSVQEFFDPGTTDVRVRFAQLGRVSGSLGTDTQTSRRNTLGWSALGGLRGPLDNDEETGATLPTSYDAGLALRDTYQLTRIDGLTFTTGAGYIGILRDPDPLGRTQDLARGAADVAWRRLLSPRSSLTLTGGGTVVYAIDSKTYDFVPTAVGAHSITYRGGGGTWTTTSAVGVQGFLDRIAANYRTQGFCRLSTVGQYGRSWTVGLTLGGSTSLTEDPIAPPTYESRATANQTTTYRISSHGAVSWGVRAGLRAPHLSTFDALDHQRELTAFVGFRWNVGTDGQNGSWLR